MQQHFLSRSFKCQLTAKHLSDKMKGEIEASRQERITKKSKRELSQP